MEVTTNQSEKKMNRSAGPNQECIDNCRNCHQVCLDMAMNHCLKTGGKHTEPEHFKLMITCAEICLACANVQTIESKFSMDLCGVCADVCDACAQSCEELDQMEECVQACRKCAESCRSMSSVAQ